MPWQDNKENACTLQCARLWKRRSSYLMRDMSGCFCDCSAQLRIIYHNRSTWCSEKACTEQELEHHNQSISANKESENSNIFPRIYLGSPSQLSLAPPSQLFPPFLDAFNMPPSPHVNLLLQWHGSLGESFLITPPAPIQVPLSHALICHSNY